MARPKKSRPSAVHSAPAFAPHSPPISQPSLETNLGLSAAPSTPEVTEEVDEADIDDQVCSRGFLKQLSLSTCLQMDWIGGQLSMLIAEGRRALGTEVVVMSESKEDEIDDGLGTWVDEDNRIAASTSGSLRGRRKARPSNIALMSPPPSYIPRQKNSERNMHLTVIQA